jgi:hypothetical protein
MTACSHEKMYPLTAVHTDCGMPYGAYDHGQPLHDPTRSRPVSGSARESARRYRLGESSSAAPSLASGASSAAPPLASSPPQLPDGGGDGGGSSGGGGGGGGGGVDEGDEHQHAAAGSWRIVMNCSSNPFSMDIRLPKYEAGVHIPSERTRGRDEQFETVEFVLLQGDSFVFFEGAGVYLVHQAVAPVGTSVCFAVFDVDLQVASVHAVFALHLHYMILHLLCICTCMHTLQCTQCT